jgi:hypothetical protein
MAFLLAVLSPKKCLPGQGEKGGLRQGTTDREYAFNALVAPRAQGFEGDPPPQLYAVRVKWSAIAASPGSKIDLSSNI